MSFKNTTLQQAPIILVRTLSFCLNRKKLDSCFHSCKTKKYFQVSIFGIFAPNSKMFCNIKSFEWLHYISRKHWKISLKPKKTSWPRLFSSNFCHIWYFFKVLENISCAPLWKIIKYGKHLAKNEEKLWFSGCPTKKQLYQNARDHLDHSEKAKDQLACIKKQL